MCVNKICIWNPGECTCKNCKCLKSITGDSVITCDRIIEATKAAPTKFIPTKTITGNFNEEKVTCKL